MPAAQIFDLTGKRALVVGAGEVAGAIADLYAKAGAAVTRAATSDVATEAAVEAIFAPLERVDILVNGAVRIGAYPLETMSLDTWDEIQGVNLRGAFLLMRAAVRAMRRQGEGGRIINISTMGALHPVLHGNFAYGSSRAGLSGLVRAFALEGAADRILVNAILVGAVMSDPWPGDAPAPTGPGVNAARFPLGRGAPADVAPMALLLASAGGAYITGQTLSIDGGFAIA